MARGLFTWKYKGKGFRKSGLKIGVVFGFIHMVYSRGNTIGKASEKVVLRQGWSLARILFI